VSARDDDPVPIADALAQVRAELGLPDGDALGTLVERWSEVVGADVAAHARLEALRDGTLVVATDDPIWASQLRYLEGAIRDRANELAGGPVVAAVTVRVRPR
jgi:predicted nucleic acid-binding Zn ribbon protein